MKIFIGLTEVSGYYSRLKQGFDVLGVPAEFVPLQIHRFGYSSNASSTLVARFARYAVLRRIHCMESGSPLRYFWLVPLAVSRVLLFIWALPRFQVFIFGGGSSFFNFLEFPILRLFRRKIIYMFHGTDCRPAWMDGFCEDILAKTTSDIASGDGLSESEASAYRVSNQRRMRTVKKVEKYATQIISAPSQSQLQTREFIIGLAVGLPVDALVPSPSRAEPRAGKVRALHCPSFHTGKGTSEIRAAIAALVAEGVAIEYVEICNRPNIEVRAEISKCDFVIDQVYSDTPMAGFASEAALAGKPAVVGGYYSAHASEDLGEELMPPSLFCHPAHLMAAIKKMATDESFRTRLGAQAEQFVRNRWRPEHVAGNFLRIAQGDVPEAWFYSPSSGCYFHGMGLTEERLATNINGVTSRYGLSALGIDELPDLKKLVVNFMCRDNGSE